MLDGIIYDCPNVNCTTPLYTGECRKDCHERHDKEMGKKPITNADHIRSMSNEDLEVFLCGIAATNGCMGCMVSKYCSFGNNGMKYWLRTPYKENTDE